jgi:hypothetical protein
LDLDLSTTELPAQLYSSSKTAEVQNRLQGPKACRMTHAHGKSVWQIICVPFAIEVEIVCWWNNQDLLSDWSEQNTLICLSLDNVFTTAASTKAVGLKMTHDPPPNSILQQ